MSPVCTPWELDEACCDLPEDTDEDLVAHWQEVSSEILFRASGMRYGTCPVTIRPCLRSCGGGVSWVPYKNADGEWLNVNVCGCADDCSCTTLCEIVLPGPVASVTQVLIDGDELMDDSYRLDVVDGQYRLLRTDGNCWPSCSDVTADCEDVGAFCVTYEQGIELDALAIAANSALTCQLVRACLNCKCDLPKNVQSVVRRGVAIQFDTARTWVRTLPAVAAFIDSVNPNGLMSQSTVWSPDVSTPRVTPSPSVS